MKSSRLRGAALAWGAILASGTVYSQAPYSTGPGPYHYPQPYYSAPAQPYYTLPPVHLPTTTQTSPVPVNLAGQLNYATYSRGSTAPVANSLVSDSPISVLSSPTQASNQFAGGQPAGTESIAPGSPAPGAMQGGQVQGPGQHGPANAAQNNYYYGYGQSPANADYYGGSGMGGGKGYGGMGGGYGAGMGGGYGPGSVGMGHGGSAMDYGAGSAGVGAGDGCGGYGQAGHGFDCGCPQPRPARWYAGAYGMWLSRDNYDHFTFSFDTGNESIQLTDARDAKQSWEGGFAVAVGHYFNCGMNALEFVYWGWYPDDASVYTYNSQTIGNLNGIFNWGSLNYNGAIATQWVDNARVHALWRQTNVHNFELNVLRLGGVSHGPFQFSMLGGARIFRYEDMLTFGSETTDNSFDGDLSELYYQIETVNKLYGFQLGGVGSWAASPRFVLNGGTKFGIFLNKISHTSSIGGGAGYATINNGPFLGEEWYVRSSKEDVSFLGEVFLGGSYCVTPRWSLSAGYRAVAITGIAQPTDQIYPDLRGINDVYSIESSSSMILHGMYFGGQFCW